MHFVAVVDDDPAQADCLEKTLATLPQAEILVTRTFTGVDALARAMEKEGYVPSICFMDVKLSNSDRFDNGIDAVGQLFPRGSMTQVIYVTGFIEYCTSVYETDHVYFLTKPVKTADLSAAVDRALAALAEYEERLLPVMVNGTIRALEARDICFIESARRKALIHIGEDVVETYAKLSDLLRELPTSFIQCHKSFLVNMDCVRELASRSILLAGGEKIPVSRQRSAEVRTTYLAHLRSRL